MRLADAQRCMEEMLEAGVDLHDIEHYIRLVDVSDQARAGLLRSARLAKAQPVLEALMPPTAVRPTASHRVPNQRGLA
jgi:predicted HD phosphohydrolase